jgi:pimeloyl-ACP methyl ester carboxylesterase
MRCLALRTASFAILGMAALAATSCIDVPQDPPFTAEQFTVADFNPTLGKVPFPMLTPCPVAVNSQNGACPSGGTYDVTRNRVALPIVPCTGTNIPAGCDSESSQQLKAALNTLDGFSTYGSLRTTFSKGLNAASVTKQNAFLLNPTTGAIAAFRPVLASVDNTATLIFEPDRPSFGAVTSAVTPLAPETTYLAILTNGLLDAAGKPVEPDTTFALFRSRSPLANPDGTLLFGSLLSNKTPESLGCSGTTTEKEACARATRATLEAGRRSYDQIFTALERPPLSLAREKIVLLWTIKTQSTYKALLGLRASLIGNPQGVPAVMTRNSERTVPGWAFFSGANAETPYIAVDTFQNGCTLSPLLLRKPTETFRVDGSGNPIVAANFIPYVLAIPKGNRPATGWPVAIFGHGLGGWRYHMIGIANALAAVGIATIAIDHPWHGDRTNLILGGTDASGNPVAGTENSNNPSACVPRLPNAPEAESRGHQCPVGSTPQLDGTCQDASGNEVPKLLSGAKMLNPANLFATRDNFRQAALDLMQLVYTLRTRTVTNDGISFDPTQIFYVGQSLGGIVGPLFLATEPAVRIGVLNVPGGGISHVIQETASLSLCKPVFDGLAQAGVCVRADAINQPCKCNDTAAYRQFMHIVQWVVDPADPINYANNLVEKPLWCLAGNSLVPCAVGGGTPQPKKVLVQKMANDPIVPNSTTHALVGAMGPKVCYREFTGGSHGFLVDPSNLTLARQAQYQVLSFLLSHGAATNVEAITGITSTAADACP